MGPDGIFKHAREGCLVIDSSTVAPQATKEMTEIGESLGFRVADVPISGGYMGARAGTLTCIVGCRKKDYDEIHQIYSCMGKNIFYCGEPGAGQSAKICNNLGLAIQNISVAEALSLGEKLGVDINTLAKIMSLSTGMCWAVKVNTPIPGFDPSLPASHDYEHGFEVNLMK
uniref:3-hydroxyisobutyrate dehydrogenase n=1 Tax=Euplotes harpa TaxID=151035 RepID=A0A7S3J5B7_9SPIT|mmetsp:Transcript_20950/g.24174  ORF Transcript_20950/g.24174 Transcript_20950/m.24174 type:complete len:171 (+) Transcript_20950:162-674(+)